MDLNSYPVFNKHQLNIYQEKVLFVFAEFFVLRGDILDGLYLF